jgi:predicted nucleotidyltransferase
VSQDAYERIVAALAPDLGVRLIYAFGSSARGAPGARDVDVAVLLARRPTWDEERMLRAAVAAAEPRADLVVLNDAPPALRREVLAGGRCLLARSEAERAELEILSLARDLDFQPMRRVQDAYMRARVGERRGAAHRRRP